MSNYGSIMLGYFIGCLLTFVLVRWYYRLMMKDLRRGPKCPFCKATGRINKRMCIYCDGTGIRKSER